MRWRRQGVNHFSGTGVMQAFSRLFFNRLRVRLQGFDLLFQSCILLLHVLNLLLDRTRLLPLLAVYQQTVGAKHHVITKKQNQR